MDLGLQNKVAMITGTSRGVGKAIATNLAAEGCRLVIIARGREALEETAEELQRTGAEVLAIAADMTVLADIEQSVQQALAHYGHIDILVHNAGGAKGQDIFDTSCQDWHKALALNVRPLRTLPNLLLPPPIHPARPPTIPTPSIMS